MKNIKYIALVLMLAFSLVGFAYAYWETELTIQGTVNSAKFEVLFDSVHSHPIGDESFSGVGIINEGGTLIFTLSNIYPKADNENQSNLSIEIKNNSTIPVNFDEAVFISVDNAELLRWMRARIDVSHYVSATDATKSIGTTGPVYLTDLAGALNSLLDGVQLDKGDKLSFGGDTFYIWLSKDAPAETTAGQTGQFTLEMKWKQFE